MQCENWFKNLWYYGARVAIACATGARCVAPGVQPRRIRRVPPPQRLAFSSRRIVSAPSIPVGGRRFACWNLFNASMVRLPLTPEASLWTRYVPSKNLRAPLAGLQLRQVLHTDQCSGLPSEAM
jgi:hypothetical protein